MPTLTRWFIKSSLVYLIVALIFSILSMGRTIVDLPEVVAYLRPVHVHLFMVGWVTQLIFGMVYWMFPKYSKEKPHKSEGLAWGAFGLLNIGLILRLLGEPLNALSAHAAWGWLLVVSASVQWLAGIAFVLNTWPRIKER
jgi:cbb3-type cytochrome oxidase subunit 1